MGSDSIEFTIKLQSDGILSVCTCAAVAFSHDSMMNVIYTGTLRAYVQLYLFTLENNQYRSEQELVKLSTTTE